MSILIAAYNEEASIADTLRSIANQDYPGAFEVFVIDDGSRDRTAAIVDACDHDWLQLLRQPQNAGKSAALNRGLAEARFDLVVTLDADSFLYRDALRNLVERYLDDPPNTRAVAGTMLVRNSRKNWVTKAQEWDYFHGIAAIKRVQSLYQGTLVAQGAFSLYERAALREVGGWVDCVGEDIVLTWAMLRKGWRVGHAEDACCFTNAPDTLHQFVRQRQRWARGMMEAFRQFPDILRQAAAVDAFRLVEPALPVARSRVYAVLHPRHRARAVRHLLDRGPVDARAAADGARHQLRDVSRRLADVRVERTSRAAQPVRASSTYAFVYSLILQPACVAGYFSEILGPAQDLGHEVTRWVVAALALVLACERARASRRRHSAISTSRAIPTASMHRAFASADSIRTRRTSITSASPSRRRTIRSTTGAAMRTAWSACGATRTRRRSPAINAEAGCRAGGRTYARRRRRHVGTAPAADTGVELIAAGDLVATQKAIDRAIAYGFFAASVEHTFAERFTAVGLAGYQPFTDGNDRVHWRGRLIWQVAPDYGVNVQLRWRQYESRKNDVDGAYFNPDRYRQWQGALGMRRRFGSWMLSGRLAPAARRSTAPTTIRCGSPKLRGEGALTDRLRLALYALYSRSTGYVDAPIMRTGRWA